MGVGGAAPVVLRSREAGMHEGSGATWGLRTLRRLLLLCTVVEVLEVAVEDVVLGAVVLAAGPRGGLEPA